jgi:hypothetical protein
LGFAIVEAAQVDRRTWPVPPFPEIDIFAMQDRSRRVLKNGKPLARGAPEIPRSDSINPPFGLSGSEMQSWAGRQTFVADNQDERNSNNRTGGSLRRRIVPSPVA